MRLIHTLLLALLAAPAVAADVRIAERDVFPESVTADARGRLYVGSIRGIVSRTAPGGDVAEPWIRRDAANGLLAIMGVLADDRSRTLWVCSSPFPFGNPPAVGTSALVAFDLASGRLKRAYPLPPPASACNDVALDAKGAAFATDTANGRIFTLAPGAKALALFAQDARMVGIDGIAFAADGTLYTNNVRSHSMQRIDRKADGSFAGFTDLALSQPIKGPDGLRPIGGSRFLQAESGGTGGKLTEVTIAGDRAEVRTLWEGPQSTPGVTPARGRAYVTEGKIGHLFDPKLKGQDPNPFLIRAVPAQAGK